MSDTAVQVISISCLGEFSLSLNGADRIKVRPKVSELLTLLLLSGGKHLLRSHICGQLWRGVNPSLAKGNLRAHLKLLRDDMGTQEWRILATDGTIGFDMRNADVDALVFQHSLHSAKLRKDIADIEAALRLYRDDLLPKSLVAAIVRERNKVHEVYLKGLESLAEGLMLVEQRERALQFLTQALKLHPERESVVAPMLRLLHDRPRDALRVFNTYAGAIRKRSDLKISEIIRAQIERICAEPPDPIEDEASETSGPATRIVRLPVSHHPLIGRSEEIESITNRLVRASPITLVGPCGVGKTRLALEIGSQCAANYRDGVVFVDLSHVKPDDGKECINERIAETIISALEIESGEAGAAADLIKFLSRRHFLLILDKAEHLAAATVGLLREVLKACTRLSVLVTSRSELVRGFGVHIRIKPLDVPDAEDIAFDDVRKSDAVKLFENTARLARFDFALTHSNAGTVLRILRVTGGLPLAIHLVASAEYLTLQELLEQLEKGLTVFENTRSSDGLHGVPSICQSVASSYEMLTTDEKNLLVGLSVFVGGWYREAIDGVFGAASPGAAGPTAVLDTLRAKSLVERIELEGRSRYRLLEPIREHAHERLTESGESELIAQKHLIYYVECVERIAALADSDELNDAMRRLAVDLDNLRSALDFSLASNQIEQALRLATGLARYFYVTGHVTEGHIWMERVASLGEDATPVLRRKGYHSIAVIAYVRNDYGRAQRYWKRCLALCEETDDSNGILQALGNLGGVALALGEFTSARSQFEQCLKGYRRQGNSRGVARSLGNLALVARGEKDYVSARETYSESIAIFRELNDTYNTTLGLNNLASILISAGEHLAAHAVLAEAIELSREHENDVNLVHSLSNYVMLAVAQCDPERAAILIGADEAIRKRIGMPLPMEAQSEYQRSRVRIVGQLGQDTFTAMTNVGRSTSMHQMCLYARSVLDLPSE